MLLSKADNCTGTVNVQGDASGRSKLIVKSVQSALSDLLTTSATHGTFSRPSMKRGLIFIIKSFQFTIVRFFQASLGEVLFQKACH